MTARRRQPSREPGVLRRLKLPIIHVILNGDNAWADLRHKVEAADPSLIQAMGNDTVWYLVLLKGGMASGKPSIGLRLDLADGRVVVAETSWDALLLAVGALQGRVSEGYTAI